MKLLVLGTGNMAQSHVDGFKSIDGVELAACVDVDQNVAQNFADKNGIARAYDDLDKAIAAGGFDAVSNVTPDGVHYSTTMKILDAGLHIFCEKPLATNAIDANKMAGRATELGVVNGVNLTYRGISALQKAAELVSENTIGELRHIEASYLQSWLTQPFWGDWKTSPTWLWRLSERHGSAGVLGDIGIHVLDFTTFATGSDVTSLSCNLKTFDKAPGNQIGEYHLDVNDSFSMTVNLENGATGVVHASRFASGHINELSLKLFGTLGGLRITNNGDLGTLEICTGDDLETATWRNVQLSTVDTNYQRFADAVYGKAKMDPDFQTAARLQEVLDQAIQSDKSGARINLS